MIRDVTSWMFLFLTRSLTTLCYQAFVYFSKSKCFLLASVKKFVCASLLVNHSARLMKVTIASWGNGPLKWDILYLILKDHKFWFVTYDQKPPLRVIVKNDLFSIKNKISWKCPLKIQHDGGFYLKNYFSICSQGPSLFMIRKKKIITIFSNHWMIKI